MNPILQARRFDPEGQFVRKYLPELAHVPAECVHTPWEMPPLLQSQIGCVIGRDYPAPVVDHAKARIHAIAKFQQL
jgi:deoxyribodipyrimidine photo-lyase